MNLYIYNIQYYTVQWCVSVIEVVTGLRHIGHCCVTGWNCETLMVVAIGWYHRGLFETHGAQVISHSAGATPQNQVMTTPIGNGCGFMKPRSLVRSKNGSVPLQILRLVIKDWQCLVSISPILKDQIDQI